tara:strand:+ start:1324 stop:1776 length:453 start_codon:yes stop_codon:yes gene_type:complete
MTGNGTQLIKEMTEGMKRLEKGGNMAKKNTPKECLCKCPKQQPVPAPTPTKSTELANQGHFVNFMMAVVAAPVVLSWVGLAFLLIIQAFSDQAILEGIEAYKSVLLIVGSPALVIIYKTLEMWTAQQNSQIEQIRKGTFRNGEHNHDKEE